MSPDVRVAESDADREAALVVRRDVFIEEQGVPEEVEMDGKDEDAIHFVATADGDPIGAARLREVGSGVRKVERVAVVADRRDDGIGRKLMRTLEATAVERDIDRLVMHAQTHVQAFYLSLDYETTSDVFEEAGIDHVEMEKEL
jgi:predicted GNAT family N-acyltransferase